MKTKSCETPDEALEVIDGNDVVLVDVYGKSCRPCKLLEDELQKVQKRHKNVFVLRINKDDMRKNEKEWLDKIPLLEEAYKLSGVPVLLFIKNGKVIDQYLDEDRDGLGLYWGLVYSSTIIKTLEKYAMI